LDIDNELPMLRREIRNSKSEIRNKFKTRNGNDPNPDGNLFVGCPVEALKGVGTATYVGDDGPLRFEFLSLDIRICFGFRASDFGF